MEVGQIVLRIIEVIFFVNIAFIILVVLFERRNPSATLTWILALLFIPVLGFVLYLFLGQDLRRKRLFYLKQEEEAGLYPMLELQQECLRLQILQFADPRLMEYQDMIHLNLSSNQSLLTQDNKVNVYDDGQALFAGMIESLRKSEKYIHMEYYIIRNDTLGREILQLLTQKAREGVEVKLLYDGMGGMRLPRKYFTELIASGGKVAVFFPPLLPYFNLRVNFRNHRKICLIDGREGYVGGFNIGDEYRGLSKRFGNWRDTHLKIQGSALDGLELRFLLDWRYAAREDATADQSYFPYREPSGNQAIQIVSSGPDSQWPSVKDAYLKMICQSKKNIYIHTPYFVPDESIMEALRIAALSGVDVRVVFPAKRDHPFVHWASLSYAGELLEVGARFYLYTRGFLHSKMLVSDGFVSTVGTANMDVRSFKLNFEVNAFLYDNAVAAELEGQFLRDLDDCEEITLESYQKRHITVKIREAISRLLSPIL